jgi:hypothetical protein
VSINQLISHSVNQLFSYSVIQFPENSNNIYWFN